jgi:transposase
LPWKERKALDEKRSFIVDWEREEGSLAELCRRDEISRQTGYKWLERYQQEGQQGLEERSRAPLHHPQAMPSDVRRALVDLRSEHPSWGPRKLRAYLERHTPRVHWPTASSIGDLLRREGLSHPRRRRKRTPPYTQPLKHAEAPNQVWCADFKGWFLTQDGSRFMTAHDLVTDLGRLPRDRAVHPANYPIGVYPAMRARNRLPLAGPDIENLQTSAKHRGYARSLLRHNQESRRVGRPDYGTVSGRPQVPHPRGIVGVHQNNVPAHDPGEPLLVRRPCPMSTRATAPYDLNASRSERDYLRLGATVNDGFFTVRG